MIQFTLKCANGHRFESWFQSGAAFDKLHTAGLIKCAVCGTTDVSKAMMAPNISTTAHVPAPMEPATPPAPATKPNLTAPATPAEQALSELKKYVEKNSDYVGQNFAKEARAIHSGEAPSRPIWGETRGDEAKKLIDEGVPVAPLPFTPTRKSN